MGNNKRRSPTIIDIFVIGDLQIFLIPFFMTLLIGGFFLLSGIIGIHDADLDTKNYSMCTASVQGRINKVEEKQRRYTDSDGNEYYETYFIVKYEYEANGKTYKDSFKSSHRRGVGEEIEVLYNSDEPFDHCLPGDKAVVPRNKIKFKIYLCVGVILSVLFVLLVVGRIVYKVKKRITRR